LEVVEKKGSGKVCVWEDKGLASDVKG